MGKAVTIFQFQKSQSYAQKMDRVGTSDLRVFEIVQNLCKIVEKEEIYTLKMFFDKNSLFMLSILEHRGNVLPSVYICL